jgi:hypothetical protein
LIPPAQKQPQDVIDLLFESVQQINEIKDQKTGEIKRVLEPDNESLFWRTLLINSPNFGGAALEVRKWQTLMKSAYDNMCSEVADVIFKDGMQRALDYKYGFAAKSSETIRDSHNSQSSLTHLLQRNHMEKTVTIEDKVKSGLGAAIGLGRDDQQQG